MNIKYCCLIVFLLIVICETKKSNVKKKNPIKVEENDDDDEDSVSAKIYSNLFVRRREEHKLLYKHLMGLEGYEKKYKMLIIAYKKIFDVIQENRDSLKTNQIKITSDIDNPKISIFEALIIENTCLFGDLLLHIPEISYLILKSIEEWREKIEYSLQIVKSKTHLLDVNTVKMLNILNQELNESERTIDYINPYYENVKLENAENKQKKKNAKKLKKGPKLYSGKNEL